MRAANRAGFTLLEAMVALAIVGIAVVGILGAFGTDLRGAETARTALTASTLARTRLARLEVAGPRELAVLPDSLRRGTFEPPFNRFKWTATSTAILGEPDLYDLRVTVEGPNGRTEIRSRAFRPVPLVAGRTQ